MSGFDIGILGGGQLARMSIMAAQRMGLMCLSLDAQTNTPAGQIAPALQGSLSDPEVIAQMIRQCSVITLENEFVPAKAIERALKLAGRTPDCIIPNIQCLAIIQDKLLQRDTLRKAGIPVPKAAALEDDGALAISKIGYPMILKSRFGGYDGKGTRTAKTAEAFEQYRTLWSENGGWLAEEFVPFKRELAVMVFVGPHGTGCFPTMESVQTDHVCDLVFPAEDVDASQIAIQAVAAVGGNGLFGVELFEMEDGKILVNEIAPRPHNSGHYSLDWGSASQFEQHVRMVLGLPAAPVDGVPTCMANLLGQEHAGEWRLGLKEALDADPGVFVHWYGKPESRPGRKMGHINVVGGDYVNRAKEARKRFYAAWAPNTDFPG